MRKSPDFSTRSRSWTDYSGVGSVGMTRGGLIGCLRVSGQ